MRVSLLLGVAVVVLVILPIIGLAFGSGMIRTVSQIVLSLVLLVIIGGTGLFGYISIKAQAKKWGVGLIIIALLCLLAILWIWTGKPLAVI